MVAEKRTGYRADITASGRLPAELEAFIYSAMNAS
jgi:hypothetical protein